MGAAAVATPWVALVGPEIEENLGLRYLAAALEGGGVRAEIVGYAGPEAFGAVLDALAGPHPPVLVALSLAFQWRAPDFLALALALRERGYRGHITAGGHFGTFAWPELLRDFPELDSICLYEAETTVVDLARALRDGGRVDAIDGLARCDAAGAPRRTPPRPVADLAALPWPDRRGPFAACLGHPITTLIGSRGCYAHCSFCCIAAWHEQARAGQRYRLRPVDDVAAEMAALHREHGLEIFVFHDDNFFLPGHARSLARVHALADALAARGVGRIATVVKARPTDVTEAVFRAMRDRLGLRRVFLGVETSAPQGLTTLRRWVPPEQNQAAMTVLRDLGLYVCFNMLLFDPDTTTASLATNLAFMEANGDMPLNFGRVELYAGTPLLARLLEEQRCSGDYLGWDYAIADPTAQRVWTLALACFHRRNFAGGALANRLMGTRFDVEVCRYFHPEAFEDAFLDEGRALSRTLTADSVSGLREILDFVQTHGPDAPTAAFVADLSARLRGVEREVLGRAAALEEQVQRAAGRRCRHSRAGPSVRVPRTNEVTQRTGEP
ncbi:MAG TPA: cobalamin-dependent protein [Polyangia bacterium]|jgi:radical SAM superfamily enzyme YgiQ (UPF0313 family)